MSRKRTGLRNRGRRGRSTYSTRHKSRSADMYVSMTNGKPNGQDTIAGHGVYPIRAVDYSNSNAKVDTQLKAVFHSSKP